MKSRKTRIGIFVVFALQCRVECPSVAFFIVYLCPPGKYSSETIEKLTFSYTFLYCEKQFRYLILVCMFPIAGACAEFSCHPEIRRVALLPFLYSVIPPTIRYSQVVFEYPTHYFWRDTRLDISLDSPKMNIYLNIQLKI